VHQLGSKLCKKVRARCTTSTQPESPKISHTPAADSSGGLGPVSGSSQPRSLSEYFPEGRKSLAGGLPSPIALPGASWLFTHVVMQKMSRVTV
jgi:hypothetical protein